jgi:hypothetical protein
MNMQQSLGGKATCVPFKVVVVEVVVVGNLTLTTTVLEVTDPTLLVTVTLTL